MKKQIITFSKALMICFLFLGATAYSKKAKPPIESDLTIEPSSLKTGPDQEHEIQAKGGKPPYVFKTSAGLIRYQDHVATYISPNQPGQATVTVKDAAGASKTLNIEVVVENQSAHP